ncbi:hypothetical protein CONPUDRAFT_77754 [Coniophora puteana RWD-64-598 SS2]|uniref:Uncharacterized protein n=1 Tax=Coniophora puteana (strain RWD-64-598) TaxID=741705 RepID=A0A5M3M8H2_CONPW|nr:uncharacterized protein CONPUDRAFT_77754 [Coniophora puteana RWD-64-598 SS2]EIW74971.1 hypothetical protein CONPUDRAFT_77754 [Coniophora puteana RWD-64-598 SS2]
MLPKPPFMTGNNRRTTAGKTILLSRICNPDNATKPLVYDAEGRAVSLTGLSGDLRERALNFFAEDKYDDVILRSLPVVVVFTKFEAQLEKAKFDLPVHSATQWLVQPPIKYRSADDARSIAEEIYRNDYLQRVLEIEHPPQAVVRLQYMHDPMTEYPIELLDKTITAIHGLPEDNELLVPLSAPGSETAKLLSAYFRDFMPREKMDLDVEMEEACAIPSSASGSHSPVDDVLGKPHGIWCRIRNVLLQALFVSQLASDTGNSELLKVVSSEQEGLQASVQRVHSRQLEKRRTTGVFTCKVKERLFYAREPPGKSEEDLNSDEEPEQQHEEDAALRRRQTGYYHDANPRGHWEWAWVEDDASYINPRFCLCHDQSDAEGSEDPEDTTNSEDAETAASVDGSEGDEEEVKGIPQGVQLEINGHFETSAYRTTLRETPPS